MGSHRFSISGRVVMIVLFAALPLGGGCRGIAMEEVRSNVDRHKAMLQVDPSRVKIEPAETYLSNIGAQVLEAAREVDKADSDSGNDPIEVYDQFQVYLVHSEVPNAWTFGDDFACVTTGLVLEAATPEEVAAVLAHEFGHIREGHLVEERERWMSNELWLGGLVVLGGAVDVLALSQGIYPAVSMLETCADAAEELRQDYSPHNPDDEFEADAYGLSVYKQMGLDPKYYDDYLERMGCLYGEGSGGTHPATSKRLETIQDQMADAVDAGADLDPADFQQMQSLVARGLLDQARRGELVTFEDYSQHLASQGFEMANICVCGPMQADPEIIHRRFVEALRRHATAPADGIAGETPETVSAPTEPTATPEEVEPPTSPPPVLLRLD